MPFIVLNTKLLDCGNTKIVASTMSVVFIDYEIGPKFTNESFTSLILNSSLVVF